MYVLWLVGDPSRMMLVDKHVEIPSQKSPLNAFCKIWILLKPQKAEGLGGIRTRDSSILSPESYH